jgi:hypothetical protein
LRDFPEKISVADLEHSGIMVVSIDRDAQVPPPEDIVTTGGWLRPRLWGGRPVLPVIPIGRNLWETVGGKKRRKKI